MILTRVLSQGAPRELRILRAQVEGQGRAWFEFSGDNKAELLRSLVDSLDLPGYTGLNFDAIDESLGSWAAELKTPSVLVCCVPSAFIDSHDGRIFEEVLGLAERTAASASHNDELEPMHNDALTPTPVQYPLLTVYVVECV